jgi:hypothetical protein
MLGKVVTPEPAPALQHADALARFGEPARCDPAPEARAHNDGVEGLWAAVASNHRRQHLRLRRES